MIQFPRFEVTRKLALIIKGSLLAAGWIPHRDKSVWIPVRVLKWSGFIIDLVQGKIFCTAERIEHAESLIRLIVRKENIPVKMLSKITGQIISMEKSHGEMVYLKTRFLSLYISEAPEWYSVLHLCQPVKDELLFWLTHLRTENGRDLFPSTASTQLLFSDASDTGCPTVHTAPPRFRKLVVTKIFSKEEAASSSTERELLGILHGLAELKTKLYGHSVNWITDCKNILKIIKRGSMKPYLLNMAVAIFHLARRNKVSIDMVWVPRTQNEEQTSGPASGTLTTGGSSVYGSTKYAITLN